MKILWIVNVMFPEACRKLGKPEPVVGGWLIGYYNAMQEYFPEDFHLDIVAPYDGETTLCVEGNNSRHYLFPSKMQGEELKEWFKRVKSEVHPDVIHIHGSEYYHDIAWVEACGAEHTVVSIQGLVSIYARYYMAGISDQERRRHFSINDWRHHRTLADGQRRYVERGLCEKALLSRIEYVAGRTSWDKSHVLTFNPDVRYFICQEVLRKPFYETERTWELSSCRRHSIFLSQSHYPLKGLHKVLEALPILLRHYPDTQVYIVGDNPTDGRWYQRSTFGNLLHSLIRKHRLADHLHFLGRLSAGEMAEQYRQAHIFICPSSIENSSNSLCEAQIIGTPTIASYVGGLPDLIRDGETGLLYRFEEIEMLAEKVRQLFADDDLATRISRQGRETALARHDRKEIAQQLFNIYHTIS